MPRDWDPKRVLSPEEQTAFLSSRGCPSQLLGGTFDQFCSLLFALQAVAIHTESRQVNQTKLAAVFPDFYQPTYAELFDTIARQTRATVQYDSARNYWVFLPPPAPLPYTLVLAEHWQAEDRGPYVCYIPPAARVGMDIYLAGRYSAEETGTDLFTRVRQAQALRFASSLTGITSVEDMKRVTVDGEESLFYESSTIPRANTTWRQWVFVKAGQAFVIVSALENPKEARLLPNVLAMVKSFKTVRGEDGTGLTS